MGLEAPFTTTFGPVPKFQVHFTGLPVVDPVTCEVDGSNVTVAPVQTVSFGAMVNLGRIPPEISTNTLSDVLQP